MVERVTVQLVCDTCHAPRQARVGESIDSLRDRLAQVGWYSDAANDIDLCPAHAYEASL